MRPLIYEVELTYFTPEPTKECHRNLLLEEATRRVPGNLACECTVLVGASNLEKSISYGDFLVWCNAERALVRLHEHCEHQATVQSFPDGSDRSVSFKDDDGSWFSVLHQETVSPDQALAALRFWLPALERTPELVWE